MIPIESEPILQEVITMKKRRRYSADFKAQVALEAINNQRTLNEIANEHGIHPNQITNWKKQVIEQLPQIFATNRDKHQQQQQALTDELYRQIGQLKVELDWVKKKVGALR